MGEVTDEFRKAMSEWVEIKTQLAEARKDMKVLNTREKELKEYVKTFMKDQQIDKVNLKKGRVTLKTTKRSGSLTKKIVEEGLKVYFNGDDTRVEGALNSIYDLIETKETDNISLTGISNKD